MLLKAVGHSLAAEPGGHPKSCVLCNLYFENGPVCDHFNLYSANISSWWHIIQYTRIVKINTPKIGKILKVEINLSLLKLMYLGQIVKFSFVVVMFLFVVVMFLFVVIMFLSQIIIFKPHLTVFVVLTSLIWIFLLLKK